VCDHRREADGEEADQPNDTDEPMRSRHSISPLFEQFHKPWSESIALVELQDPIHIFGYGADDEALNPIVSGDGQQPFYQIAAHMPVSILGPHIDVLYFQIRLLLREDFHFLVDPNRAVDIADDLTIALSDEEVFLEAFKISHELFASAIGKNVGDTFLVPQVVELENAVKIPVRTFANENLIHVLNVLKVSRPRSTAAPLIKTDIHLRSGIHRAHPPIHFNIR
jgi:hypothetical protein